MDKSCKPICVNAGFGEPNLSLQTAEKMLKTSKQGLESKTKNLQKKYRRHV